jgi:GLPGLI family protein
MKKLSIILFAVFLFIGNVVNAQKKFSEGVINYDIVINTGSDKPHAADFLDGATSTVFLKGSKSRTEMVSSLGTQSTIIDESNGNIFVLKEYGDQRYLIELKPADWKDANKRYEGVTFTFTNDTKKIIGYTCKKAIGKLTDGTTFTVWYTTDLVPENNDFQTANKGLPGLAMEYEASMGNLNVTYTVSKISFGPVTAAKFDLPKSGYRVMSYAESRGGK